MGIPVPISVAFWASTVGMGDAQNAQSFDFAEIISDWGKVGIVNREIPPAEKKNP